MFFQIGVLIEDKELVDSYMGGKPKKAGKFAHSLRLSLWSEHLGLRGGEVSHKYDNCCLAFSSKAFTEPHPCDWGLVVANHSINEEELTIAHIIWLTVCSLFLFPDWSNKRSSCWFNLQRCVDGNCKGLNQKLKEKCYC